MAHCELHGKINNVELRNNVGHNNLSYLLRIIIVSSLSLLLHYHNVFLVILILKSCTCCWNRRNNILCALKLNRSRNSDKTNEISSVPCLIRIFAVHSVGSSGPKCCLCGQRKSLIRLGGDAQADLSLRWTHCSLCWFCHAAAQMTLTIVNTDV